MPWIGQDLCGNTLKLGNRIYVIPFGDIMDNEPEPRGVGMDLLRHKIRAPTHVFKHTLMRPDHADQVISTILGGTEHDICLIERRVRLANAIERQGRIITPDQYDLLVTFREQLAKRIRRTFSDPDSLLRQQSTIDWQHLAQSSRRARLGYI